MRAQQAGHQDWQRALRQFLAARTRREVEHKLDWLQREFFSVVIRRVLTEELRRGAPGSPADVAEAEETFSDISLVVRAKIAHKLLTLWEQPPPKDHIGYLPAYVATVARNACVDDLRRKYPGRHALDNGLRAALENRPALALWRSLLENDVQEWRCGKVEWRDQERQPRFLRASLSLQSQLAAALEGVDRAEALSRIFEVTQAPLRFIELLNFLCDLWDVEEPYRLAERQFVPFRVPKPYQTGLQPEEVVSIMGTLQTLWRQIKTLSPPQAAVLLLKLPPFENATYLHALVRFQITDWGGIARTVGLELPTLHEIAHELPLEDAAIAPLLGLTPEDVPRIRQDARRRLQRRQNHS